MPDIGSTPPVNTAVAAPQYRDRPRTGAKPTRVALCPRLGRQHLLGQASIRAMRHPRQIQSETLN
jgi:hypothetical protein